MSNPIGVGPNPTPAAPDCARDCAPVADRPPHPLLSRRTMLASAGGVAVIAAIAACGGGGSEDTDTASPDRGTGSELVPSGAVLAQAEDVPEDGAISVDVGGAKLLVTQPKTGEFAAFSAICTHQRCTVLPGSGELKCPCHGSRFNLATGAVLGGPAPTPLPAVNVKVENGRVLAV